jgi:hypothetical protein
MIALKDYWLGSQKAGMLGCNKNTGLPGFQAFQLQAY